MQAPPNRPKVLFFLFRIGLNVSISVGAADATENKTATVHRTVFPAALGFDPGGDADLECVRKKWTPEREQGSSDGTSTAKSTEGSPFLFLGIPKGSTVAVSTYMVSEHGNHSDQKEFFLKGYNEMLRRVEPERIICYNTPFPEMEGNVVFVDYELSSWKYQGQLDEVSLSPYAKYIAGRLPLPENSGIVIKQGTIIHDRAEKGSGSVHGGKWRPNPEKPNEMILRGEPNTIKRVFIPNRRKDGGYNALVKYDERGWAIKMRHLTTMGLVDAFGSQPSDLPSHCSSC